MSYVRRFNFRRGTGDENVTHGKNLTTFTRVATKQESWTICGDHEGI